MGTHATDIAAQARSLTEQEKLALIDDLLAQLERPDPEVDRVWADEAKKRWRHAVRRRARALREGVRGRVEGHEPGA